MTNELLLAFIATDGNTTTPITVKSVTGASLTWQLVVRTNAQAGTSEIWRAFAPTVLTNVTVTLFGATDGVNVWLFLVNTDSANSILYSKFDGNVWSPWTVVPGTGAGIHTRNYLSDYPHVANGQIGLIWTEGSTSHDELTTSLRVQ